MTNKHIQIIEQATSEGISFEIVAGSTLLAAHSDKSEPFVVTFTSVQGKPIEPRMVLDSALLVAESELRKKGYRFFNVALQGEDPVEFPSVESLSQLPKLDSDMRLLYEADRYDGPISGLVEHSGSTQIFWFNWCTESGHGNGSRVYSLRPVPQETIPQLRDWIETYNDLTAELHLLGLVQQWPVSDRQRSSLRDSAEIQNELMRHEGRLPELELRSQLITSWMPECMEELAAIRVVWISKEDSARREKWQKAVALALRSQNQDELNMLFENPAEPLTDLDLFKVTSLNSDGTPLTIARNHLGQFVSDDFWLTAKHRIHDLSHLVD